jgi:molybdopterin converting factor small subunit
MMNIEVELYGQLATNKQRKQVMDLYRPMKIREVVILLGLDEKYIGLITVNGVQNELDDFVQSGCRLCFFPHMSGG